eukprot:scaffold356484_cov51-Prasinocladus_malaysianus.AAC.1
MSGIIDSKKSIGSIKITKDGIEIITLQEGSYFGEIGILHHVPRSASCVALVDCEVFVLTKASLHEVSEPDHQHASCAYLCPSQPL